jgi:hypothetical protein
LFSDWQARISLKAGGAAARGPARGGRIWGPFILLVLKISPAAPFPEHFLGCHFTKILLSGHFPQKNCLWRRLTFIFCHHAYPQKEAAQARKDLNPALVIGVQQ